MVRALLSQIFRVIKPFWKTKARKTAALYLGLALLFTFGLVYSQYLMTEWNQTFYDALQKTDKAAFGKSVSSFVWISILLVTVTGLQFFFAESLGIKWRKGLTKYCLDLWISKGNNYFWNHIPNPGDNPDQRISQDVELFVKGILAIGVEAFKQSITMIVFIVMLWGLSENFTIAGTKILGFLVWVSIGYAMLGTTVSHLMGRKVLPLSIKQQIHEADFRSHLMRTREHAESIVLMNGQASERKNLLGTLGEVIQNYGKLIHKRTGLTMFASGYTTFATALPILIAAPSFFNGEITLGVIMQTSVAFQFVNGAMSYFVTFYAVVAEWTAAVKRLDGYMDAMDQADTLRKATQAKIQTADSLQVEDLRINFPQSTNKSARITAEVGMGQSMIIMGASGAGKSTLLRVFAGIWPYFEGKIARPEGKYMLFLPQKSYIPNGSLRNALAYPLPADSLNHNEVCDVLDFCGLGHFIPRLDKQERWEQVLSLGEQQRLGWVRAFLHKPDILFLDEATSALDEAMQMRMYAYIKVHIPEVTVISVAHRSELMEYHDSCLDLTPSPSEQDNGNENQEPQSASFKAG